MNKNFNLSKVASRAAIKDIMKTNSLRAISLANYSRFKNEPVGSVYSVKVDIQDGYINLYGSSNGRAADVMLTDLDVSADIYENVFAKVKEIIDNESNIPYRVKRNILVKLSR